MRIEQTHSSYRDKKKRRLSLLLLFQMKKKSKDNGRENFLKKQKNCLDILFLFFK